MWVVLFYPFGYVIMLLQYQEYIASYGMTTDEWEVEKDMEEVVLA
jgi:hypothetical protein